MQILFISYLLKSSLPVYAKLQHEGTTFELLAKLRCCILRHLQVI